MNLFSSGCHLPWVWNIQDPWSLHGWFQIDHHLEHIFQIHGLGQSVSEYVSGGFQHQRVAEQTKASVTETFFPKESASAVTEIIFVLSDNKKGNLEFQYKLVNNILYLSLVLFSHICTMVWKKYGGHKKSKLRF